MGNYDSSKYRVVPLVDAIKSSEKKFCDFATAYNEYLISYENNYNANGEAIGGGTLSFIDFVSHSSTDLSSHNSINHSRFSIIWTNIYWIIVLAILAFIVIYICIVASNKKKKKAKKEKEKLKEQMNLVLAEVNKLK